MQLHFHGKKYGKEKRFSTQATVKFIFGATTFLRKRFAKINKLLMIPWKKFFPMVGQTWFSVEHTKVSLFIEIPTALHLSLLLAAQNVKQYHKIFLRLWEGPGGNASATVGNIYCSLRIWNSKTKEYGRSNESLPFLFWRKNQCSIL